MRHTLSSMIPLLLLACSCVKDKPETKIECSTLEATEITSASAVLHGHATVSGFEFGSPSAMFYLGSADATAEELVAEGTRLQAGRIPSAGTEFSYRLTDLKEGRSYGFVAVVEAGGKSARGEVCTFTAITRSAVLKTRDAQDISSDGARLGGSTDASADISFSNPFVLVAEGEADIAALQKEGIRFNAGDIVDGEFIAAVFGLKPDMLYSYAAAAASDGKTVYGDIKSFRTEEYTGLACISGDAREIGEKSAILSGRLLIPGTGQSITGYGIEYAPLYGTEGLKSAAGYNKDAEGNFEVSVKNLNINSRYHYRCYVKTVDTVIYGSFKTFDTSDFTAEVKVVPVAVEKMDMTGTITLVLNTKDELDTQACFYYSRHESTAEGLMVAGTKVGPLTFKDGVSDFTLEWLDAGAEYSIVACAEIEGRPFISEVGKFKMKKPSCPAGAVDLGLSVCWHEFNLGANALESAGGYYAFGETSEKPSLSGYLWSNYTHCNGTSDVLTKYCTLAKFGNNGFTDGKTVLESSDDAATVILKGTWRTPTNREWQELIRSCTATYEQVKGTSGWRYTSKKEGFENASIFLPLTGWKSSKNLEMANRHAFYRTSEIVPEEPYKSINYYGFYNSSSSSGTFSHNTCQRYQGDPIRPVCD